MKKKEKLVLHNLIIKEDGLYAAICLEFDVASQGETVEEAEANIKEAVELYLEDVYESRDEKDFIPRPAPPELWLKYFKAEQRKIKRQLQAEQKIRRQLEAKGKKLRRQLKAGLEPELKLRLKDFKAEEKKLRRQLKAELDTNLVFEIAVA